MSETYVTYRVWGGCKAPLNLEYDGRLIGEIARELTADRDALLALADEMEAFAETECCAQAIDDAVCDRINAFANRIREALGVIE